MLYAFLRLFAIPLVMLVWVIHRLVVKRKPMREILPDLQLVLFVCAFYYVVYFVLLGWIFLSGAEVKTLPSLAFKSYNFSPSQNSSDFWLFFDGIVKFVAAPFENSRWVLALSPLNGRVVCVLYACWMREWTKIVTYLKARRRVAAASNSNTTPTQLIYNPPDLAKPPIWPVIFPPKK